MKQAVVTSERFGCRSHRDLKFCLPSGAAFRLQYTGNLARRVRGFVDLSMRDGVCVCVCVCFEVNVPPEQVARGDPEPESRAHCCGLGFGVTQQVHVAIWYVLGP